MKTKNLKLLFAISFLLFCFLQNVNAQTIYVDATNNTGIEDGSQEHPFNTIIEGIDAASEQDTVFVAHGTYNESYVFIDKAICLIGEDKETTLINGMLTMIDTAELILPYTVQNLSFKQFLRSLYPIGNAPLQIVSCNFNDYVDTLAVLDTTSFLSLLDNIISDSIYIINGKGDCDRVIKNCQVGGDISINAATIKANIKIDSNILDGKLICSSLLFPDSLFITNNIITDSLVVSSSIGAVTTVKNNTFKNSAYFLITANQGLFFDSNIIENGNLVCVSTLIESSLVTENDFQNGGIQCVARKAEVLIKGNFIYPPFGETGIDISGERFGSIIENEIILDYLAPSGLPETEDTLASCGIRVFSVAIDSIYNNTIEGGTYGIYAKSVAIPIGGNSIKFAHHGLYSEAISCKLISNNVTNCEGSGMILDLYEYEDFDSSGFYLYKNTFESNKNNGLVLRNYAILGDSANMTTSGENIFKNNIGYDLYVETPVTLATIIKAQRNIWNYTSAEEINENGIYDGKDNPAVSVVDFEPFYISGIEEELHNKFDFEIFPNPAREVVSLQFSVHRFQSATIEIYDLNGKKLLKKQIHAGTKELKLDVSNLKSGIHFCKISTEQYSVTKKLLIQK